MDEARIEQIIAKHGNDAGSLIQVLLEIQRENQWLTQEVLENISRKLDVPLSKVVRTATFYKSLSTIPEGRHEVHICNGTSCHVRGSQQIIETVRALTGNRPGETDPDLRFTIEAVTCMGRCASGPVMEVDGRHHGKIDPKTAEAVLKRCD